MTAMTDDGMIGKTNAPPTEPGNAPQIKQTAPMKWTFFLSIITCAKEEGKNDASADATATLGSTEMRIKVGARKTPPTPTVPHAIPERKATTT